MTYTHDEIMAMDADALRLAIAEAKGWVFTKMRKDSRYVYAVPADEMEDIAIYPGMGNDEIKWGDVPDWANDIAAAWELVEEMGATNPVEVGTGNPYFCRVYDEQYVCTVMVRGEGDTAPLAIAKAWLTWKAGR